MRTTHQTGTPEQRRKARIELLEGEQRAGREYNILLTRKERSKDDDDIGKDFGDYG